MHKTAFSVVGFLALTAASAASADSFSLQQNGKNYTCTEDTAPALSVGCYCTSSAGVAGWVQAKIHALNVQTGAEVWDRFLAGNGNWGGIPRAFFCVPGNPQQCDPNETQWGEHSLSSGSAALAVCQGIIANSTECR